MKSNKVYLQRNFAPDKKLGYVQENGDVFREDFGLNDRMGHVDIISGRITRHKQAAPDDLVGHVDVDNGKIHLEVPASPDKYIGRVNTNGDLNLHMAGQPDIKIGSIKNMESLAHGGGAFLLLVLPAFEEKKG